MWGYEHYCTIFSIFTNEKKLICRMHTVFLGPYQMKHLNCVYLTNEQKIEIYDKYYPGFRIHNLFNVG